MNSKRDYAGLTRQKRRRPAHKNGFALVVTLSLMILLTIMAVGLLSLSSVALRTTSQSSASANARNNARLALMLALNELQITLGPDQGVSAPAASVHSNTPQRNLTGAWKGWHWMPSRTGSPAYSEKADRFARWLVSTTNPAQATTFNYAAGAAPTGANAVQLVGEGKDSQDNPTEVFAGKVRVTNTAQSGKLAWAVFDESAKAAIHLDHSTNSASDGLEIASRKAPDRFRPDALDVSLDSLEEPKNLISLDTAIIPAGSTRKDAFRSRFHDFTTSSLGLLTNTAHGGLKTDLTQLFEANSMPRDAFEEPFDTNPYPAGFGGGDGTPTWNFLHAYYQKYKNITSSREPTYDLTTTAAKRTDLRVKRLGSGGRETGVDPEPAYERMLPVVAKMQLVFSLVSHSPFPVDDRRKFLDDRGDPRGWDNYGVVNLVYDPVITLYNPYDVTLRLERTRIRVWDPPVQFRFRKHDNRLNTVSYFRNPSSFDGWAGLAQLQIGNDNDYTDARKSFTMVLADGNPSGLTDRLVLLPGEVKVFGARVEDGWTWGQETSGGYGQVSGVFFDWDASKNFANVDRRTNARYGKFGVESIPRWDARAGLQADHLAGSRTPESYYQFEQGRNQGFVTIRKTDDVSVEARPWVASSKASTNFRVDVLAGISAATNSGSDIETDRFSIGEANDTLRSYRFLFQNQDLSSELSANPSNPIISRKYNVGQIFQSDSDKTKGGKKPFAMLEMSARPTKDDLTDNKPWLYNNVVVEGGLQDSNTIGLSNQAYDLRLIEMTSFDSFPDGISIDPDTYRGYFGASDSIDDGGSSFVTMMHVPVAPAASLGEFIHGNLVNSALLPRVVHPFGNANAHPLISSDKVAEGQLVDHSYLLNDALWDSCFISSITSYGQGVVAQNRSLSDVLTGVLNRTRPALNSRMAPVSSVGNADALAKDIAQLDDITRARRMAAHIGVDGPFNVNSVSVDAWSAVLMALRDRTVRGLRFQNPTTLQDHSYGNDKVTPFVRAGKPVAGPNADEFLRWAAFRTLTDGQIIDLAKEIVEEIVNRGASDKAPSMTLGEFVNRRVQSGSGLHVLTGLLQTAINNSGVNDSDHKRDSKSLNPGGIAGSRKKGVMNDNAMSGNSAEGAPTMITQGDLMAALAPIATVRGDTFKIRAYGEATTPDGGTVTARAWCEAVVQRVPGFVDPTDEAETSFDNLTNVNKTFGRRFEMVSFRWLNQEEL